MVEEQPGEKVEEEQAADEVNKSEDSERVANRLSSIDERLVALNESGAKILDVRGGVQVSG